MHEDDRMIVGAIPTAFPEEPIFYENHNKNVRELYRPARRAETALRGNVRLVRPAAKLLVRRDRPAWRGGI